LAEHGINLYRIVSNIWKEFFDRVPSQSELGVNNLVILILNTMLPDNVQLVATVDDDCD